MSVFLNPSVAGAPVAAPSIPIYSRAQMPAEAQAKLDDLLTRGDISGDLNNSIQLKIQELNPPLTTHTMAVRTCLTSGSLSTNAACAKTRTKTATSFAVRTSASKPSMMSLAVRPI
jgi:hypothetical protein